MSRESREREATEGRGGEELPERWSTRRKVEVVLRLLRGEDLGEVSRELQVSPVDLEEWRRVFLERGQQGLKRRTLSANVRETRSTQRIRVGRSRENEHVGTARENGREW